MGKDKTKGRVSPILVKDRDTAEASLFAIRVLSQEAADWAMRIGAMTAKQAVIEEDISHHNKAVERWAEKDRKNWPGKSLSLANGTVSFQVSPGKITVIKNIVKNLKGALKLLALSRKALTAKFLRPKPSVLNGELIIQEFTDGRVTNEQLSEFGLRVDKPEVCKIEVFP
jgi:hypothetical protein